MTDLLGPLKNIRAVQPEVDVPSEDPPCPPALGGLTLQEKDSLDDSDPIITPGAFKRLQAKQADQAELQRFLSKHRFLLEIRSLFFTLLVEDMSFLGNRIRI